MHTHSRRRRRRWSMRRNDNADDRMFDVCACVWGKTLETLICAMRDVTYILLCEHVVRAVATVVRAQFSPTYEGQWSLLFFSDISVLVCSFRERERVRASSKHFWTKITQMCNAISISHTLYWLSRFFLDNISTFNFSVLLLQARRPLLQQIESINCSCNIETQNVCIRKQWNNNNNINFYMDVVCSVSFVRIECFVSLLLSLFFCVCVVDLMRSNNRRKNNEIKKKRILVSIGFVFGLCLCVCAVRAQLCTFRCRLHSGSNHNNETKRESAHEI